MGEIGCQGGTRSVLLRAAKIAALNAAPGRAGLKLGRWKPKRGAAFAA
jgi:hypothetical protein